MLMLMALVGTDAAFTRFQERFAEHSQLVEPELERLRGENNELRLQLIHQILPRFGNLTVNLRQLTWDTWEHIENHEKTTESCMPQLRYLLDLNVLSAKVYVTSLAQEMYWELRDDVAFRFNPSASFMSHENTRATHQTVQTLGRNRFTDGDGATLEELQDELNYHHNLWVVYEEILRKELDAIQPLEKYVMGELDWWYENILEDYTERMETLIDRIDLYCWDQDKAKL